MKKYFYVKLFGITKKFKFASMKDFISMCEGKGYSIKEIGFQNGQTKLYTTDNDYKKFLSLLPEKFHN